MVFILQLANGVFHIYCFAYVESSRHTRNKSHLVLEDDFSNILLDSVSYYFVTDFCNFVLQGYGSIILSLFYFWF